MRSYRRALHGIRPSVPTEISTDWRPFTGGAVPSYPNGFDCEVLLPCGTVSKIQRYDNTWDRVVAYRFGKVQGYGGYDEGTTAMGVLLSGNYKDAGLEYSNLAWLNWSYESRSPNFERDYFVRVLRRSGYSPKTIASDVNKVYLECLSDLQEIREIDDWDNVLAVAPYERYRINNYPSWEVNSGCGPNPFGGDALVDIIYRSGDMSMSRLTESLSFKLEDSANDITLYKVVMQF